MAGDNYTQRSHKLSFSEEGKAQFVSIGMILPQLDVLFALGWESGPKKILDLESKSFRFSAKSEAFTFALTNFYACAKP
jgi:hypothetical protein